MPWRYIFQEYVRCPVIVRYVTHGRAEIDSNLVENSIRPTAVGKRNFLFVGHPDAGWRSAVIYSVLGSCSRLGIDPHEYLRDVLRRLPVWSAKMLSRGDGRRRPDLKFN